MLPPKFPDRDDSVWVIAAFLALSFTLPSPAFALRTETSKEAGAEEQLQLALADPADPVGATARVITSRLAGTLGLPAVTPPPSSVLPAAGLEEGLLKEYLQESLKVWEVGGRIQVFAGDLIADVARKKLDETYAGYWQKIRQNLRHNRQAISIEQWRSQSRVVFIQILRKHLAVSVWKKNIPHGESLRPSALFTVFFGPEGYVEEAYSIPGLFQIVRVHDVQDHFANGQGLLPFAFSLRGTLEGKLDSSEGFIRLDPPSRPELFLKEKLGTDSVSAEAQDLYPEILAEEVVNVLGFLSEGGVHPDKPVVFLKEVREAIGRRYGVNIPKRWTLGQFSNAVRSGSTADLPHMETTTPLLPQREEGQVIRSVRVNNPQGLHLRTAVEIKRLLVPISPQTRVTIREGERLSDARQILDLLKLVVDPGETVDVIGEGPQAREAAEILVRFLATPSSAGLEEKPINLAPQSGLPVTLDPGSWALEFGGGMPVVTPAVRRTETLQEVAQDPHRVTNHPSQVAYWMYRNVYDPNHLSVIMKNQLRYDITILAPSDNEHRLGQELVKTYGHYHPPRDPLPYPEVYEVLSGEAWFLLQKPTPRNPAVIEDVLLVKAHSGEKAVMLPGYGHITINPSRTNPLVMANWVSSAFDSQYERYQEYRGAAYYITWSDALGAEFLPNRAYASVPSIREMRPAAELPEFGLKANQPMYPLIQEPERLAFLNEPERFVNSFTRAFVPVTSQEQLQALGERLKDLGFAQFSWDPAVQEDPALWRQAVRHIPALLRQNPRVFDSVLNGGKAVQVGWGLEIRPPITGTGAAQLVAVEASSTQPYEVYADFAEFLRQRASEVGATSLSLNEEGAFYKAPGIPQDNRLDGVFLPEGLWEFLRDRRLTLSLPISSGPQLDWRQIHWLLDPRTLRQNVVVEASTTGIPVPIRGPTGFLLGSLRGYVGAVAGDSETARLAPSHFIIYLAGLEEDRIRETVRQFSEVAEHNVGVLVITQGGLEKHPELMRLARHPEFAKRMVVFAAAIQAAQLARWRGFGVRVIDENDFDGLVIALLSMEKADRVTVLEKADTLTQALAKVLPPSIRVIHLAIGAQIKGILSAFIPGKELDRFDPEDLGTLARLSAA